MWQTRWMWNTVLCLRFPASFLTSSVVVRWWWWAAHWRQFWAWHRRMHPRLACFSCCASSSPSPTPPATPPHSCYVGFQLQYDHLREIKRFALFLARIWSNITSFFTTKLEMFRSSAAFVAKIGSILVYSYQKLPRIWHLSAVSLRNVLDTRIIESNSKLHSNHRWTSGLAGTRIEF